MRATDTGILPAITSRYILAYCPWFALHAKVKVDKVNVAVTRPSRLGAFAQGA